jgi:hypothetical protein
MVCDIEQAFYLRLCTSLINKQARIYFSPSKKKTDCLSSLDGGNFYKCYFWLSNVRKSHLRSLFSWGRQIRTMPSKCAPPLSNNLGSAPEQVWQFTGDPAWASMQGDHSSTPAQFEDNWIILAKLTRLHTMIKEVICPRPYYQYRE